MARVNLDDDDFGNPRIARLGRILKTSKYDALGRMAYVIRFCTDRQDPVVDGRDLDDLVDVDGFAHALVEAQLAAPHDELRVRILDIEERISWLGKVRSNAAKGGAGNKRRLEKLMSQEASQPGASRVRSQEATHPDNQEASQPAIRAATQPASQEATQLESHRASPLALALAPVLAPALAPAGSQEASQPAPAPEPLITGARGNLADTTDAPEVTRRLVRELNRLTGKSFPEDQTWGIVANVRTALEARCTEAEMLAMIRAKVAMWAGTARAGMCAPHVLLGREIQNYVAEARPAKASAAGPALRSSLPDPRDRSGIALEEAQHARAGRPSPWFHDARRWRMTADVNGDPVGPPPGPGGRPAPPPPDVAAELEVAS
jgi:hypothetical protein